MTESKLIIGGIANPLAVFKASENQILDLSYTTGVDIIGAELSIDELTALVRNTATEDVVQIVGGTDFDSIVSSDDMLMATSMRLVPLNEVPYGTIVEYWRGDNLMVKAYFKEVTRQSREGYNITAISPVGLLEAQRHYGGIYNGTLFGTVLADIIGGIAPYTIDDTVANTPVYGWLPIATRRDNLHQLLFAFGVMCGRNSAGDMHFRFISNAQTIVIPERRVYDAGSIEFPERASEVQVTEHTFSAQVTDEEVTEFDNTSAETASHTIVEFQNAPLHDLAVTGTLTIEASGVNYAVVSGAGTLTGRKYSHTTRVVAVNDEDAETHSVVTCDSCFLVSLSNAASVADRLLSYYTSRKTVTSSFVVDTEKAGDLVTLTDPYMESVTGFVSTLTARASGKLKAEARIITDFIPAQGGGNFTAAVIFDTDQTIDLDAIVAQFPDKQNDLIQLVFIGGGHGGYSGANGNGTNGGAGGAGGEGGKVLSVSVHLEDLASRVFSLTVGQGGNSDEDGTATFMGEWSSEDGRVMPNGYGNIFSGAIYGRRGTAGIAGGKGGNGGNGASVTYNGRTWEGGSKQSYTYQYTQTYRPTSTVQVTNNYSGAGGSGGGAAVGQRGGAATPYSSDPEMLGVGGDGGDAIAGTDATVYGCGGNGGHGGGGAGRGGRVTVHWTSHDYITLEDDSGTDSYNRDSGTPGRGSAGGKGGNGVLLVMV